jgi:soluble lytic murein transglycosylase-like protein
VIAARGTRARNQLAGVLCALLAAAPLTADQQRDPELQAVVAKAIAEAQCFSDQYDSAVWYTLMEPRLRKVLPNKDERLDILKQVYCETHRQGEVRLPPGLVMAVIAVESRFDRWAVSAAGAVGLMQVMPFWPERLGMRRYELVHIAPNVRMGCAILRFYLGYERNDVRKALARYNGSIGRRDYPDLVIGQWTSRWAGADDLGFPKTAAQ